MCSQVWCIDRSVKADQIAQTISSSLMATESPDLLLARLYLVSDILYNVSHAYAYQAAFDFCLGPAFIYMGKVLKTLGRIRADAFQKSVTGVISCWTSWHAFDAVFLQHLADSFLQKAPPPIPKNIIPRKESKITKDASAVERKVDVEKQCDAPKRKNLFKPAALVEDTSVPLVEDTSVPLIALEGNAKGKLPLNGQKRPGKHVSLLAGKKAAKPLPPRSIDFKRGLAASTMAGGLGKGKKGDKGAGGFKISFAASEKSVLSSVAAYEDIDGEPMDDSDLYEHIDGEPMDAGKGH